MPVMTTNRVRPGYLITTMIVFILLVLLLNVFGNLLFPLVGTVSGAGTRGEYYSVELNSTKTSQKTDGKNPVDYVLTIINTGNKQDSFTIYAELLDVTDCSEPDKKEWSYYLDTSLITLGPSQSAPIVLTVLTSCGCQIGCIATITVHAVSGAESTVRDSITTYTTRGASKQVYGLQVEIDFNPALNVLSLDTLMEFDVFVYNIQNQKDTIIVWPTQGPAEWSIGVTPQQFSLQPNSKRLVTLSFTLPKNITIGEYPITLTAQSTDSPSVQGKDNIIVPIKPDIIINNITLPKGTIQAGVTVDLKITVENMGLATATNIPIVIYDEINLTTEHELLREVIEVLEPNQSTIIIVRWQPTKGSYNLTIWLDPNGTVEELSDMNNYRIEPITVEGASSQVSGDSEFYYVFLIILVLIIICLVIYFKFTKKRSKPDQKTADTEDMKSEKYLGPERRPEDAIAGHERMRSERKNKGKFKR